MTSTENPLAASTFTQAKSLRDIAKEELAKAQECEKAFKDAEGRLEQCNGQSDQEKRQRLASEARDCIGLLDALKVREKRFYVNHFERADDCEALREKGLGETLLVCVGEWHAHVKAVVEQRRALAMIISAEYAMESAATEQNIALRIEVEGLKTKHEKQMQVARAAMQAARDGASNAAQEIAKKQAELAEMLHSLPQ